MKKESVYGLLLALALFLSINLVSAGISSYYKFENNIEDLIGINDGTNNGVAYVNDASGKALSFNGTGNINFGQPSSLDFNPSVDEFTIGVWVKIDSGKQGTIIAKRDESDRQYQIYVIDNVVGAWVGGKQLHTNKVVANGAWRHIVLVNYDDSGVKKFKLYVDGVTTGGNANSGSVTNDVDVMLGARRSNGNAGHEFPLVGIIDELKIWNQALTSTQINAEHNSYLTAVDLLEIYDVSPNDETIKVSELPYTLNLSLMTRGGIDNGNVICYRLLNLTLKYLLPSGEILNIPLPPEWPFDDTGTNLHTLQLSLSEEITFDVDLKCIDLSGNIALSDTEVTIKLVSSNETSCTDTDGGLNYEVKGYVKAIYPDGGIEEKEDSCNGNILDEGYCGEYEPEALDKFYTCPNGCYDGACIAGGGVDVCDKLSFEVKSKIKELQALGENVILREGDKVNQSDYFVISAEGGTIFKVTRISNSSSSTASDDEITLKNVFTGESKSYKADTEGIGTFTSNGKVYLYNYHGAAIISNSKAMYVTIDSPDEEIETFYCSINGGGACSDLVDFVKNPADFVDSGFGYTLIYNWSSSQDEWINGVLYDTTQYAASWSTESEGGYSSIFYDVIVFDDLNVNLDSWLKERTDYQVCRTENYWSSYDEVNRVYICNWNILSNSQDIGGNYQHKPREVLWVKDNVIVKLNIHTGERLTDEEILRIGQKRIIEFLDDLRDNRAEYLDWEDFSIDWPLNNLISDSLSMCPSDIDPTACSPSWQCQTEPAICPPHGYQTKTCVDWSCDSEDVTRRVSCSPGICSGCIVPRWFDSKFDNTCIPYGFRFDQQTDWEYTLREIKDTDLIPESSSGEYILEVLSDTEATLILYDDSGDGEYTYELSEGVTIDLTDIGLYGVINYTMTVDEIVYSSVDGASYVVATFDILYEGRSKPVTLDAYCDFDGEVKVQKADWTRCQNSYECSSNLCSGQQCTGINTILDESNRLKGLGVKVLCRLADFFAVQDYDSCVVQYLGDDFRESDGGSGGGGSPEPQPVEDEPATEEPASGGGSGGSGGSGSTTP